MARSQRKADVDRFEGKEGKEEVMRKTLGALSIISLALLLASQTVLSQEGQDKLKSEVQELLARMDRAMVDGSVEGILAFYADDAVMLPNNAPKITGKAALRKKMEESLKSGVSFGSFMETVDRAWECGGMVYCVGGYAMSANVPGIPRPVGDKGKSFAVFRRSTDGTLKIAYDMWNTDVEYGK
jgi:ketosteroid isomerase-like protein